MLTKHKIFIPPYNHRQMLNKHKIKKILYSRMDADPANMIINLLYPLYFRMITYLAYLLHFPTLSLKKKFLILFQKISYTPWWCWPSIIFILSFYMLGWLLIDYRKKFFIITCDDCWFSLPSELWDKTKLEIKNVP